MTEFKFVHTADLHLDSPFVGLQEVNDRVAGELREATFRTFDRIIDLCLDRRADFLLVAGDVYDAGDRGLRAQLRFRDGLERLSDAGIASFVVCGNHDPLSGWSAKLEWPEHVHTFGANEVTSAPVVRDGETIARVYGISYATRDTRKNLAVSFRRPDDDGPFAIGLLHCNVGADTGHVPYAPCTLEDLTKVGMDYWALGHVHAHRVLCPGGPAVVYPGNTQGRSSRELGARGCYVVEVDADCHPTLEFVPVDTVRWFQESVPIERLGTDEELVSAVDEVCQRMREQAEGRPSVGRVEFTGRGPAHRSLARPGFVADLLESVRETQGGGDPFVWVERLEVDTRPPIDVEKRRSGQDFVADFLDLVDGYRKDPGLLDSLKLHLEPLFHSQRARRFVETPTDQELLEWLETAETMCLDQLIDEDD